MEVNTEKKLGPKYSNKQLIVIITVFFSIVLTLPFGIFSWLKKDVQISVDGKTIEAKTYAKTVAEVLAEEGITYRKEDRIKPKGSTEIEDDLVVEVERAFPVRILADGEEVEVYTTTIKVEDILKVAKVDVNELDKIEPGLTQLVQEDTKINIIRVSEKEEKKDIGIDFQAEKKPDKSLYQGQKKVLQQGQEGLRQQVIKVTYEDGKEVSREIIEEKVVKEPIKQIVAYGTKPKVQTVTRGGKSLTYSKEFIVEATAYTHTGNNTSRGTKPGVGTIAVDPRVIPYGTRLYVEGYGYGVALDTGSAIRGNRIDVFFDTKSQAINWGRKNVKIFILK